MEITPIIIKEVVIVAIVCIGLVAAYTVFALAVAAHLRENSKNYPEVE